MGGGVGRVVAAGTAYAVVFVFVTGALPPPSSPLAAALLADLYLLLPALFGFVLVARAARRATGAERAFWTLLAGACAGQVLNQLAFAGGQFAPSGTLDAVRLAGWYTFNVFVAVAFVVLPHRTVSAARAGTAVLECLMVVAAVCFAVFYFVAIPFGETAYPWFWIFTAQQILLPAGFVALALAVREGPYATVYRILAIGLGLSAAVGVLPNWRWAAGSHTLYSPGNVDWIVTFTALAAAAAVPRSGSWTPRPEGLEVDGPRSWLAPAAVLVPALVHAVMSGLGAQAHLSQPRALLTVAATAVLIALAAMRLFGPRRALPIPEAAESSAEYLHFAGGVAHELNNPLMAVSGWAEIAVGRGQPRAPLEALLAATRRAAAVVSRLQRIGNAAGARPAAAPLSGDSGGLRLPGGAAGARRRRALLWGTIAFLVLYYGVRAVESATWVGALLLALPAAGAGYLLYVRARASRSPRRALFWRLLAMGALAWVVGELLWVAFELAGIDPSHTAVTALSIFFLGFLVPMIAAVALKPHGRERPADPVLIADCGLVLAVIAYAFTRIALLPLAGLTAASATRRGVLAALCALLAGSAALAWRRAESAGWRRAYAYVATFAFSYGVLSALAIGLDGHMPPPGGPADLAWIAPFVLLAMATLGPPSAASSTTPAMLLVAAPLVIVLDLLVALEWPHAPGREAGAATLLVLAALAAAVAARLRLETVAERRARKEAGLRAEEMQRAVRLGELVSVTAASVGELHEALEEVCRQARGAAVILPDKGDQMLQQARRARDIVRELSASLRIAGPIEARRDVDLAHLVEDVVQSAVDGGLAVQVTIDGLAGLGAVTGDRRGLAAAVEHLVRNAAQASPGGVLRITGAVEHGQAVIRFSDDGPGVAPDLRAAIFDPFFTTRRVGQGLGLGLTLVHFVARDHGGSVVLEEPGSGARFALKLPLPAGGLADQARAEWPFAAAALLSAAAAVLLAVVVPGHRAPASLALQIGAGAVAMAGMVWAARGQDGGLRRFWTLLAAGCGLWTLTRVVYVMTSVAGAPSGIGISHLVLYPFADLSWAAALLLRPDRRNEQGPSLSAGVGAALLLFAYAHVHLSVLPAPYALGDPALGQQLVIVRGGLKMVLAGWAIGLALYARTPAWRAFYRRVGAALGLWAVGQAMALHFRSEPGYAVGALSDLGWIVPFLFLAALAMREGRRRESVEPVGAMTASSVAGAAPWLLALAGIVAVEGLLGARSGHPALDSARDALLRVMVVVLAMLMAAHEWLTRRAREAVARTARESTPSQWLRLVASAIHELGGHLSGIAALDRLLLHPKAPVDVRTDALRIHDRVEAATRVVRNLLTALPASVAATERVSLDRVVEAALESRTVALAEDGVAVRWTPGRVPGATLDSAAVRHVVLWLLDRAVVSIRSTGVAGGIELATATRDGTLVLTIADTGRTPSGGLMARVMGALLDTAPSDAELEMGRVLVSESVARQGGTITFGPRAGGGAVFEIRLPMAMAEAARFGERTGRAG